MTTLEILTKLLEQDKHKLIDTPLNNELDFIQEAMKLYAQQFIDVANKIIGPASDILGEEYDEEYENWHKIQKINED